MPIPLPLYLSTYHWPASFVFSQRERCAYFPSSGGCSHSPAHHPRFQRNEVNDGPLGHRMHYIGSWRPRPFTIRQGCCSMCGGVGLGTILPISCAVWPLSLALPRFQSYNSDGQNPCEIPGFLDSACTGHCASSIPLPPTKFPIHQCLQTAIGFFDLPSGHNYLTPQRDNEVIKKCDCNTVFYSLVVACSLCQINATTNPLTYALRKSPTILLTNHG